MTNNKKLIGSRPDQIPTNGTLSELAFQSKESVNITGGSASLSTFEMNEYFKDITATAVDVFVYDTSRDSDGGAWRKRTQHTSWYNEELNTPTRGSRREFPAVAVIVAEANKVTIYDGDDPALPMWMSDTGNSIVDTTIFPGGNYVSCVTMKNGELVWGFGVNSGNYGGASRLSFPSDKAIRYINGSRGTRYADNIVDAIKNNVSLPFLLPNLYAVLFNNQTNDVDITVLPNAPINPLTGLPTPTIAFATSTGIAILKDDGSIAKITNSSSAYTASFDVYFDESNNLWFNQGSNSTSYNGWVYVFAMPLSGNTVITLNTQTASGDDPIAMFQRNTTVGGSIPFQVFSDRTRLSENTVAATQGVGRLSVNYDDPTTSMGAQIASSYNTGYQVGDIKGAFLSDTDDTDLVGKELIFNGLFNESTEGWSSTRAATLEIENDQMKVISGGIQYGKASQIIETVPGKTYTVEATAITGTSNGGLVVGTTQDGYNLVNVTWNSSFTGSIQRYFTASTNKTYVGLQCNSATAGTYAYFDNISVKLADHDRSVNNKDLVIPSAIYSPFDYDLRLKFDTEAYMVDRESSTFESAITHARAGNATMTDSDGLIKWAPHNFKNRSEDFTSGWSIVGSLSSVTTNTLTDDATLGYHAVGAGIGNNVLGSGVRRLIQCGFKGGTIGYASISAYDAASSYVYATIDLSTGLIENSGKAGSSILHSATVAGTSSDGYYQLVLDVTYVGSDNPSYSVGLSDDGTITDRGMKAYSGSGNTLNIKYFSVSRKDLGGMVNNPDQPAGLETYVPTTDSARYLPRRGHHVYNGTSWTNQGVLHESEARTNLLTYSEEFDNAAWTKTNSTITTNTIIAPDGTLTADKFFGDAITSFVAIENAALSVTAALHTASIYVKSDETRFVQLLWLNTASTQFANFDLLDKVVTGGTYTSATITDVGSGFSRISITSTLAAIQNARFSLSLQNTGTGTRAASYTGDGTSGIYIWGAQLEAGATPSSYIPAVGAQVTRPAETLTIPAANLPYSSEAMTIQMEGEMNYADEDTASQYYLIRWYGDGNNQILTRFSTDGANTGEMNFWQISGGVTDFIDSSGTAYSPSVQVPFNIASRHGSTFINGAVDGTVLTANTTPTALPNLSSANLNLGFDYMGTIRQFRMWGGDIKDDGILFVTEPDLTPSLNLQFNNSEEDSFVIDNWSE